MDYFFINNTFQGILIVFGYIIYILIVLSACRNARRAITYIEITEI